MNDTNKTELNGEELEQVTGGISNVDAHTEIIQRCNDGKSLTWTYTGYGDDLGAHSYAVPHSDGMTIKP